MPRFAANLGHLFTERPLIERFGAAAAAGFAAVELQFPYDIAPSAVTAELKRHGLTQLGVNTPQCPEFGLAALPGRERDWDAAFKRALDYVVAIGGSAIHCMTGTVPPEQRPAAETVFIKNLERAAADAAKANITLLIEPINPRDRPGYFLSRVEHAADVIAKVGAPNVRIQFDFYHVQIVSRRSAQALRKILPRDRPRADRRGADPRRARRRRDQLSRRVRSHRPLRLCGLDRLRIQATHPHRGRARLGEKIRRRAERELNMRLEGKTALVTGAGSGIGKCIAETYAREGARVALADINVDAAKAAARAIGNNAIAMRCDVTKKADFAAAVAETLSAFGGLDILVNNAGTTHINKPMMEIGEEEFDRTFAVNVKGVFLGCQAVVPVFRKAGGGVIINIGSTAAIRPRPGTSAYAGTKGAVHTITKGLAGELAEDKIRVCAIAPVATETPLLPSFLGPKPGQREKFVASVPLGRLALVQDIANAALFLASKDAEFLTGNIVEVDGGRCV